MKSSYLLVFSTWLSSLVLLAGCNKTNDPLPIKSWTISDPNSVVKASRITKIISENGETNFMYDGEGKVTAASESLNWETKNGSIIRKTSISKNYDLIYSKGILTQVNVSHQSVITETFEDGRERNQATTSRSNSTISYEYNGKNHVSKIVVKKYDKEGSPEEIREVIWEYDNNGKPEKAIHYIEGKIRYYNTLEWTGENVSKMLNYHYNDSDSLILTNEVTLTKFDDKENPLAILAVLEGALFETCISKNNFREMVSIYSNSENSFTPPVSTTVQLEYDNSERLTQANFTHTNLSNGSESKSSFTFSY